MICPTSKTAKNNEKARARFLSLVHLFTPSIIAGATKASYLLRYTYTLRSLKEEVSRNTHIWPIYSLRMWLLSGRRSSKPLRSPSWLVPPVCQSDSQRLRARMWSIRLRLAYIEYPLDNRRNPARSREKAQRSGPHLWRKNFASSSEWAATTIRADCPLSGPMNHMHRWLRLLYSDAKSLKCLDWSAAINGVPLLGRRGHDWQAPRLKTWGKAWSHQYCFDCLTFSETFILIWLILTRFCL